MMQRRTKRLVGFVLVAGAAVVGATFARVAPTVAQQGKPLVRGNAYGEWRHWGADQWSTRYSPLEQVNAGNFDSLQVAWEWNIGCGTTRSVFHEWPSGPILKNRPRSILIRARC